MLCMSSRLVLRVVGYVRGGRCCGNRGDGCAEGIKSGEGQARRYLSNTHSNCRRGSSAMLIHKSSPRDTHDTGVPLGFLLGCSHECGSVNPLENAPPRLLSLCVPGHTAYCAAPGRLGLLSRRAALDCLDGPIKTPQTYSTAPLQRRKNSWRTSRRSLSPR